MVLCLTFVDQSEPVAEPYVADPGAVARIGKNEVRRVQVEHIRLTLG